MLMHGKNALIFLVLHGQSVHIDKCDIKIINKSWRFCAVRGNDLNNILTLIILQIILASRKRWFRFLSIINVKKHSRLINGGIAHSCDGNGA